MSKKYQGPVCISVALVIMVIVFISSSMTYKEQSLVPVFSHFTGFFDWIGSLPLINKIRFQYGDVIVSFEEGERIAAVEFFIRKGAHFLTFFMIGFFWCRGLILSKTKIWISVLVSTIIGVSYAGFDEFHQGITGGRTPLMLDAVLDSFGAIVGVTVAYLIHHSKRRLKF